jgi:hypothetical protein
VTSQHHQHQYTDAGVADLQYHPAGVWVKVEDQRAHRRAASRRRPSQAKLGLAAGAQAGAGRRRREGDTVESLWRSHAGGRRFWNRPVTAGTVDS